MGGFLPTPKASTQAGGRIGEKQEFFFFLIKKKKTLGQVN
jgi:hypothetical protein